MVANEDEDGEAIVFWIWVLMGFDDFQLGSTGNLSSGIEEEDSEGFR